MLSYILLMYIFKNQNFERKKESSRKNLRLLRLNCNFRTILSPIVGLLTSSLRTQELYSAYFVHCAELWSEHKMTLRGKNREVWHWSFGKCQNIYCRTVWRFMSLARICDVGQIIANSQISSSLVVSRGTKLCNGDTDFLIFCTNALPLKNKNKLKAVLFPIAKYFVKLHRVLEWFSSFFVQLKKSSQTLSSH